MQQALAACSLARDDAVSNGRGMVILHKRVARSAGLRRRFQKAEQGVLAVAAGGFVLHVEEVPGGLQGGKAAVGDVIAKQACVFSGGVFVPFAIQEQHRHADLFRRIQIALAIAVQYVVDVKVHLPVLMLGEAADMAIVEALEQRRQVFADGVVDQMTDPVAVTAAEVIDAALKVIEHVRIDYRENELITAFSMRRGCWARRPEWRRRPREGQHVFGGEVIDQLQQNLPFDFLRQMFLMPVVGF